MSMCLLLRIQVGPTNWVTRIHSAELHPKVSHRTLEFVRGEVLSGRIHTEADARIHAEAFVNT